MEKIIESTAAFIMIIPLIALNREGVLLIPFACIIALSTISAPESENPPWWYFGILVDEEYWILLFSTVIALLLK